GGDICLRVFAGRVKRCAPLTPALLEAHPETAARPDLCVAGPSRGPQIRRVFSGLGSLPRLDLGAFATFPDGLLEAHPETAARPDLCVAGPSRGPQIRRVFSGLGSLPRLDLGAFATFPDGLLGCSTPGYELAQPGSLPRGMICPSAPAGRDTLSRW